MNETFCVQFGNCVYSHHYKQYLRTCVCIIKTKPSRREIWHQRILEREKYIKKKKYYFLSLWRKKKNYNNFLCPIAIIQHYYSYNTEIKARENGYTKYIRKIVCVHVCVVWTDRRSARVSLSFSSSRVDYFRNFFSIRRV